MNKGIVRERTSSPLVINMENWVTQQMFAGEKLEIKTLSRNSRVTITNARSKDIRQMNVGQKLPTHKYLKAILQLSEVWTQGI